MFDTWVSGHCQISNPKVVGAVEVNGILLVGRLEQRRVCSHSWTTIIVNSTVKSTVESTVGSTVAVCHLGLRSLANLQP